ncbi:beta-lactamase family protein [Luteimonas viscosa]|uniref:Beta-lactamase family protein n=1 Tax=Luteimonas viscosa TaxID=1132694 RepID=A0A5D4XM07_9GAMM|nr:serine hydrolase domain-containing protein [Luteimonas viscosa]TYT25708.1 beta-lactamase family protein [Luteimonas viscosa]
MKAKLHRPRQARLGRALLVGLLSAIALSSTAQTPLAWNKDAGATADVTPAPTAIVHPTDRPAPLPADIQRMPLADTFDVRVFEAMAQDLVANQRVPGLAMAIVHDGKVLSARGYGITDVSHAEPVDAHTVFRLASLSKSFAGTLTGMLVSEGALRWDSRVADFMPSLSFADPAAAQSLTVADVLSHRVGLRHHTYDRDIEANAEYHNLVQRFAAAPMACAPGQCYGYQNVAFSLVGDVVFAASGQFYSEAVTRRIFKPLGMNDASLGLEGITASARWARPHVRAGGGWKSLMPKPTYYWLAPAAGVNASISDMAQWLLAQSGRRPDVLPAPLLATLQSPIVGTPGEMRGASWRRERLNAAGYGLGWRIYDYSGHRLVFHGGAVQGYRGLMAMLPERDLGVVILWNSSSSLPSGLLPTILDRAIGLPSHRWLDVDPDLESLYASDDAATPATGGPQSGEASARPQ